MNIDVIKKDFPFTVKYIELYGIESLVSTFEIPKDKYETPELLYKECIEKGVKWESVIKKLPNNVIL